MAPETNSFPFPSPSSYPLSHAVELRLPCRARTLAEGGGGEGEGRGWRLANSQGQGQERRRKLRRATWHLALGIWHVVLGVWRLVPDQLGTRPLPKTEYGVAKQGTVEAGRKQTSRQGACEEICGSVVNCVFVSMPTYVDQLRRDLPTNDIYTFLLGFVIHTFFEGIYPKQKHRYLR